MFAAYATCFTVFCSTKFFIIHPKMKKEKEKRITFSDRVSIIHHVSRVSKQIRLIS